MFVLLHILIFKYFLPSVRKVNNKPSQTNVSVDLFLITMPPASEYSEPTVLCALEMRWYCQKKKLSFLSPPSSGSFCSSQLLIPLPEHPPRAGRNTCAAVWQSVKLGWGRNVLLFKALILISSCSSSRGRRTLRTFVPTLFALQVTQM